MKIRSLILILPIALAMLFFVGCQTDDPVLPGGSVDEVEKFLGNWSVSDSPSRVNYQVKIERDPVYENQVNLRNFADAGGNAVGRVVGNSLILENQAIGGAYFAEGTGAYENEDRLVFQFDLNDGIDLESRSAVYSK